LIHFYKRCVSATTKLLLLDSLLQEISFSTMPRKTTSTSSPQNLFLRFLFWFLHFLLSCVEIFIELPRRLKSCLNTRDQLDERLLDSLDKLPKHIAFLIMEPKISCPDLAKLVFWSVSAKISIISFYDPRGKLKELEIDILKEINQTNLEETRPLNIAWRAQGEGDSVIVSKEGKYMYPDSNGNIGESEVQVSLLSHEDGKGDIVKVAQEFTNLVSEGELSIEEIDEDRISKSLYTNRGLPDPCLLIRFGSVASNGDFPPWQLRLTELSSLPSHKALKLQEFEAVLKKYGNCHQRFGK